MIPTLGILMSMNGPQWGRDDSDDNDSGDRPRPRRRNDGPPDLEEIFRDLNSRLSEIFGKKEKRGRRPDGPGGGGNSPEFDPRLVRRIVFFVLGLLLLGWLASGFYVVNASERGIVLRFGKYTATTNPGLQWHAPWPIESREIVNFSGVRAREIGYRGSDRSKVLKEALMLTKDENLIDIQFAVQYVLKNAEDFLFKNLNPEDAVMQAAETAIREIVGNKNMDEVINTGRDDVTQEAFKLMQQILDDYQTGIEISRVTMQNAQPPEQVQAAFSDAVKAGQDKERKINEGQAYANDVIPRAEGMQARLIAEAEGYRDSMIATAKGDASRFSQVLTEYAKAPDVTRKRLYLETMERVLTNTSKVMIDAKGQGNLLYLPLDKLIQAGGAVAPTIQGNSASVAPATPVAPSVFSGTTPPQLDIMQPNDSEKGRSERGTLSRDREAR